MVCQQRTIDIKTNFVNKRNTYFELILIIFAARSRSSGVSISIPIYWVTTIFNGTPFSRYRRHSIFSAASSGVISQLVKLMSACFLKGDGRHSGREADAQQGVPRRSGQRGSELEIGWGRVSERPHDLREDREERANENDGPGAPIA